jgi:hypothetical protein
MKTAGLCFDQEHSERKSRTYILQKVKPRNLIALREPTRHIFTTEFQESANRENTRLNGSLYCSDKVG